MKKILLGFIFIFILGCNDQIDENGFYIEGKNIGINKETKTKYNREGYDKEGYDREGYDKEGYNIYGYNTDSYNREGYNREGYDKKGYDKEGYDKEGYNKIGYDKEGYDREGYNKIGYDKEGYDREGYNKGEFTRYGLNKENKFDKNKFYKYKFEESKYNRNEISNYKKIQEFLFTGINYFFEEKEKLNNKLKELKKGEFETSKEFEERYNSLNKLIEKLNEEIIDIKKEYHIIHLDKEIKGKYNADNEEWIFNEEIRGLGFSPFETEISLGNSNYLKIINSSIKINATLKMNRELAKQKQKETISIRFLVTDTAKLKSRYINNMHEYVKSNFTIELYSFDITYFTVKIVGYQVFTGYGNEQKLIQEVFLD